MPELPEVQTTVNGINRHVRGLGIRDVWTDYKSAFHAGKDNIQNPVFFKKFRKAVIGTKIVRAERRGKNILVHLSNKKTIIIHMKMTGHIMYGRYRKEKKAWRAVDAGPLRDDPFNRFVHFLMALSSGKALALSDMRKFAKVTIEETDKLAQSKHLSSHGPEPLDPKFTVQRLYEALMRKPNGPIKSVLMNHEIISGIGNIYSDEILWRVGINPLERVKNIPVKKLPEIHAAIRATLEKGINFGGDSMSDYRNIKGERGKFQEKHNAYQKTGEICSKSRCNGVIRRIVVGGRSAHFCDAHQKLFKK